MNPILEKKIQYATKEELLIMLLKDTDWKFQNIIKNMEEQNFPKAIEFSKKVVDNINELKFTLKTDIGDENTQKALKNLYSLYCFLTEQLPLYVIKKDLDNVKKCYETFTTIKSIFIQ